jgi:hypothetical protein
VIIFYKKSHLFVVTTLSVLVDVHRDFVRFFIAFLHLCLVDFVVPKKKSDICNNNKTLQRIRFLSAWENKTNDRLFGRALFEWHTTKTHTKVYIKRQDSTQIT